MHSRRHSRSAARLWPLPGGVLAHEGLPFLNRGVNGGGGGRCHAVSFPEWKEFAAGAGVFGGGRLIRTKAWG